MPIPVLVLYATVSGNAEELATGLMRRIQDTKRAVECWNVADLPPEKLAQPAVILLIASTWGEGAPPPDAEEFCRGIEQDPAQLDHLQYAVFALGSSSYTDFCGCGRRLDEALARRGARRLLPRVDADIKFRALFAAWSERAMKSLEESA